MRGRSLTWLLVAPAAIGAVLVLAGAALGTTFTVTTTADSGPGSLRQAILNANANAGADQITIPAGTYAPRVRPARHHRQPDDHRRGQRDDDHATLPARPMPD